MNDDPATSANICANGLVPGQPPNLIRGRDRLQDPEHDGPEPFFAWPGWAHLRVTAIQIALVSAWFALVYIGADWLTAHRAARVRVHLEAELGLPLVPAFTVIYMSIYPLFLAIPFVLRTRPELTSLARVQAIVIAIACISFLLVPAQLAYAPPGDLGMWAGLFRFADRLNLDYNLVPSLHVALSILCLETFAARAPLRGKWLLRAWGILIAVSTLLTHQHHLLDVITAYLLALGAVQVAPVCAGLASKKLRGASRLSKPPERYCA